MFTVYLDESGSPDDTAAVVVAGFLAPAEQWIEFERNWKDALAAYSVSALHMRHFAHSLGDFKSWKGDKDKRLKFLSRLINIIRTRVYHSVADAVLMADYRKVDQVYALSETFKPYTMAARTCVTKVCDWARRNNVDEKEVAFLFEDGAADKGDLLYRLKTDQKSNYAFIRKEQAVALQAADLLAYEHLLMNTRLTSGELHYWEDCRQSLKELDKVPNNHGKDWGVYTEADLTTFCKRVGVPRRPVQSS